MSDKRVHAAVLGGSIGGILAARVLSESYQRVTVFDRDELPVTGANRRGVPQGPHSHGLLARGREVFEELFPGFTADLTARGAVMIDLQRDCLWVNEGYRMARATAGLEGLLVSRPALESYVRERILRLPNVTLRPGHEAVGLLATKDRSRVIGARVRPVDGDGGAERDHAADLVVDATGRGNRGPVWLTALGHQAPPQDRVDSGMLYVSRDYRRVPGGTDVSAIVVSPWAGQRRGGVALSAEGDRWSVTLIGMGDDWPPSGPDTTPAAFAEFVRELADRSLYDLLSTAEPLTPPLRMRLPASVRRRYERLPGLPEGFLAIGDAVCSFTPAYGQGMAVTAVQAMALRGCLAEKAGRDAELPRRFFARAAQAIDIPWHIAVGADLRFPEVQGKRGARVNFLNSYVARLHRAAAHHPPLGKAFVQVANLVSPPTRLFSPSVVAGVLRYGRTGGTAT